MGAVESRIHSETSAALREQSKHTKLLEAILDKIAIAERRQCQEQGTGNDTIRMADQWARGEVASISGHHIEEIAAAVFNNGEWPTYRKQFGNKVVVVLVE